MTPKNSKKIAKNPKNKKKKSTKKSKKNSFKESFKGSSKRFLKEKKLKQIFCEKNIQKKICNYIEEKYPGVVYSSVGDFSSSREAGRAKKLGYRVLPDLLIFHPMGSYCGLLPEIKTEQIKLNGKIVVYRGKISLPQKSVINKLNKVGYLSPIVYGYQAAKNIIDLYMSLNPGEEIKIN